ncbi:TetR/AcrR family transcriptional regulator [Cytobacillus sp. FJAT-54145]|uniref:TetR/AcrR family transcriptional regulator n=1 Tax=Cytobacillus spartinae TaxID=3299023 RepID=A0ABW6KDY9_9BACI
MRGFTEQEKQTIYQGLIQKGRDLFSTLGLKKTSIKDLTEAVGIAQGSFYLFFQSKEELYFRILENEEESIKKELLKHISIPMTADDFTQFLLKGLELISEHVLIRRLYFEGELEFVVRKLPKEIVETHIKGDNDLLLPLLHGLGIGKGQEQIISGAIRAFFLMSLHKKEIGERDYDGTIVFLAKAISNQIFKDDKHD